MEQTSETSPITPTSEIQLIQERKNKAFAWAKQNVSALSYVVLAIIVYLAVKIRTANLSKLRDITTGGWTLGPDLDPFLFLRWAAYIVEHGKIFVHDTMRYVPMGYNVKSELVLHSYLIAWFHKLASYFGSTSIEQSAAIFPAFMFALTVVAFFFWTRETFIKSLGKKQAIIIALIASFFLSVLPSILPRTIAGIPEKESAGFFFMFLAFYLYTKSYNTQTTKSQQIYALLAGITTALMGLVWGGYVFIFVTIALATLISFFLGKINMQRTISYIIWLASAVLIMNFSSARFPISAFLSSTTTGTAFLVAGILIVHQLIIKTNLKKYLDSPKLNKLPDEVKTLCIVLVLGIIISTIMFGADFIPSKIDNAMQTLVRPTADRVGITVAENRQPYFTEWEGSFGPHVKDIALVFWLFFIGSVYLFFNITKILGRKDQTISTIAYLFFLIAIIFSRYSPNSKFNGANASSMFLYASGFIVLLFFIGKIYYKHYKEGSQYIFKKIDFNLILLFSFFFLSIISARGAVRLIMVLVPSVSMLVAYLTVKSTVDALKVKEDLAKIVVWILVGIIILATFFSAYQFYKSSLGTAVNYAPSVYSQQWQKAMAWVRDNTPQYAVFGHWWDYGYWVQTIGKRATVLDGGNAHIYWNHFMGRHTLTGSDNYKALEFLYTHNTTHFLIDPTDIGKYGAFSSIGSDANFDRYSWIPTFYKQNSQTFETKNTTRIVYTGGTAIDEDIIYQENNATIFLPGRKAGIAAVIIEKNKDNSLAKSPIGVYVYQGKQYLLPMRYAYTEEEGFVDFGEGIPNGIFFFDVANVQGNQVSIDRDGALLFLSNRTVKSQLARLYLYKEDNPNFKLVHSEDDFIIGQLRAQTGFTGDFVNYQGFRGPIRIWEINYPEGIKEDPKFLEIDIPEELTTTPDSI